MKHRSALYLPFLLVFAFVLIWSNVAMAAPKTTRLVASIQSRTVRYGHPTTLTGTLKCGKKTVGRVKLTLYRNNKVYRSKTTNKKGCASYQAGGSHKYTWRWYFAGNKKYAPCWSNKEKTVPDWHKTVDPQVDADGDGASYYKTVELKERSYQFFFSYPCFVRVHLPNGDIFYQDPLGQYTTTKLVLKIPAKGKYGFELGAVSTTDSNGNTVYPPANIVIRYW
jgi:hypothetical protein